VFAISSRSFSGLPVDEQQGLELLLTAAQSLFAVSILFNLHMSLREGLALLGLFVAQFVLGVVFRDDTELVIVSVVYLTLAAIMLVRNRRILLPVLRDGFRTPYSVLAKADDEAEPPSDR
jgi:cation:H+ antiporter